MKRILLILTIAVAFTGCAQYGYIEEIHPTTNPKRTIYGVNQGGDVLFRKFKTDSTIFHGCEIRFRGYHIIEVIYPRYE